MHCANENIFLNNLDVNGKRKKINLCFCLQDQKEQDKDYNCMPKILLSDKGEILSYKPM